MHESKPTAEQERAVLVQVILQGTNRRMAEDALKELRRLTDTAGGIAVAETTQHRRTPDAAYFVGKGKLQNIKDLCVDNNAEVVIFDNDLTPTQMRNLDAALDRKVIDRTELVLQIFARRARTAEAKIQVELAQLEYMTPRLREMAKSFSRQRGGIGMRGPGETHLETRTRGLKAQIAGLRRKLKRIEKERQVQRKGRTGRPMATLVGYTNTGKSTLLNTLSGAHTYVDDRLFATLSSTIRRVHLPDGEDILMTDTVGFIRNLPHHLIASFRSTLEEVREADVLVHVADGTDPFLSDHIRIVQETLRELEVGDLPQILTLNKMDSIDEGARKPLQAAYPGASFISAQTGEGLPDLIGEIGAQLEDVGVLRAEVA